MGINDLKRYNNVKAISSLTKVEDLSVITNKTRQYLLPSLQLHGKEFLYKYTKLNFFAAGVFNTERQIIDNSITILVKGLNNSSDLDIPYLLDEYFFGELLYGKLHALVINLPVPNLSKHFLEGSYSQMYKNPKRIFKANIKDPFKARLMNQALEVCTKSEKYRLSLEKTLGTNIEKGVELDSIPDYNKEIFNYVN